jgi:hypothetical protein
MIEEALLSGYSAQGIIQYYVAIIGPIRPYHTDHGRGHYPHCRQTREHSNTKTQPNQLQSMERPRRWIAGRPRSTRVHNWNSQETDEPRPTKNMASEQRYRRKHTQGNPIRKLTWPRDGYAGRPRGLDHTQENTPAR